MAKEICETLSALLTLYGFCDGRGHTSYISSKVSQVPLSLLMYYYKVFAQHEGLKVVMCTRKLCLRCGMVALICQLLVGFLYSTSN